MGTEATFLYTAEVLLDCNIELEVQEWFRGHNLVGGRAEATFRGKLVIEGEITLVPLFKLQPTVKLTSPKLTDTKLAYENLQIRKVGPVNGGPVNFVAQKLIAAVKTTTPTLESELLDRANTAAREKVRPLLVKGLDNVEVRVLPEKKSEAKKN